MSFHAKCVTCMLVRFIKMSDYFQTTQNEESNTCFHTNKSFAPHLVFWARIIYWSMMVTAKKTLYSLAFSKGNCQHKTKDSLIHGQTRGMAYNLWTLGSLASNDCALQVSVKDKFHANTEFVAFFFFFFWISIFFLTVAVRSWTINQADEWIKLYSFLEDWYFLIIRHIFKIILRLKIYMKQLVTYNQRLIDNKDNKER